MNEVQQGNKPKVSYADFIATQRNRKPTVGQLIGRYVEEFQQHATRPLGIDARYRLLKLQRDPVSVIVAASLKRTNVIDLAKRRRQEVQAATVMHDIVCLCTVLKYAGSGVWDDCMDVSAAEVIAAKPFLMKQDLIGKSVPRERRAANDEYGALDALFEQQNENGRTVCNMVVLSRWQRMSSRRIGESCKVIWPDWSPMDSTLIVRGMKDPKRKGKIKKVALPDEANLMLWEMAYAMNERPELRTDESRIFPFNSKTASARYTMAKKKLGIKNLRLHDSRRDCASRLAERGYSSQQIRLVTGHETTVILDRTYNRPDPAKFKDMQPVRAANDPQFSVQSAPAANDDQATDAGSAA